jgi:hypothetical protein
MGNKANVKGARVQMFIDGASGPLEATINVSALNQMIPILAARTGATPLGYLVEGSPGVIACEFIEQSAAQLKRALGLDTDGLGLAPGTQMPAHVVRLHNPADGGVTTADIVIPAAVFGNFAQAKGPTGLGGYTCDLMVIEPTQPTDPEDPRVPPYWIGYTAPAEPDGGTGVAPDPIPVP